MVGSLPTLRISRQGRMRGNSLTLFERALVQAYRLGDVRAVLLLLGRRLRKGAAQGGDCGAEVTLRQQPIDK